MRFYLYTLPMLRWAVQAVQPLHSQPPRNQRVLLQQPVPNYVPVPAGRRESGAKSLAWQFLGTRSSEHVGEPIVRSLLLGSPMANADVVSAASLESRHVSRLASRLSEVDRMWGADASDQDKPVIKTSLCLFIS